MTKEEVVAIAEKVGLTGLSIIDIGYLRLFAELVSASEREACVRLCESGPERRESNGVLVVDHLSCAEAIRTRGQQ